MDGLDGIRVASPCTADWGSMRGDDRVRHCLACRRNVYDLSALSRREAEDLVRGAEGRLCVRFYRRPDGTVLTADCPVGLRALRRRMARRAAALAAAILGFIAGGCGRTSPGSTGPGTPPPASPPGPGATMGTPAALPALQGEAEMGDFLAPAPGSPSR